MDQHGPWFGRPAPSRLGPAGVPAGYRAGPPGYVPVPVPVPVPRIAPARRTAALARWAAVGLALALLVGIGFGAAGSLGATLALIGCLGWVAALVRYIVLRQNRAGQLAWDGRVLAGRTSSGWHGVDVWQVTAVAAGLPAEGGTDIDTLTLADPHGHLLVPWKRLQRMPGADGLRQALLARQAQGIPLPTVLCAAWQVAALPGAEFCGRVPPGLRRPVDRRIDAALLLASALAVPLGVLLGAAF